ncbi:BCCT family transporter [Enterovibrio norvegicus]|uniref:BCCT family transporter n=1 Tax=Enterovibrio norvegicus TaxID=188144 RepID=A0A2N7LGQ0_9GAMM|nr:BCCT family transporter [Enterovibrio norvegicus]MCC4799439.1 BCCT family transporter [Enterovibrio norvegicus]OEE58718.1 BCCT transporter [Enterovibrio norvegicus]OEF53609.1 BCCT transporter [Enterovibrio norvegicus]OEF56863.1 BCCT transporter [Enterovibrio norvegicus]PMH69713.1 BCCT transporter [Enterovibrio norvegicus]
MTFKSLIASDKLVSTLTIGFFSCFLFAALFDLQSFTNTINSLYAMSANIFGYAWQWLMVLNFAIALIIAISPAGRMTLGKKLKPEMSTFRWLSMIMCTLLAGGGVFWSAAEPVYHFMSAPPVFSGAEPYTEAAASAALGQSFFHWGFLAWAVLGTLATIVLMHAHHHKGLSLRPRALLYPLCGDRLENHWLGAVVDTCAIIGVAAGTIGPIGFLASQLGYSVESLTGMENTLTLQISILLGVVAVYSISAFSGLDKGLQWLSKMNVIGAFALLVAVLFLGPTQFIFGEFAAGFGTYISHFSSLGLDAANEGWQSGWTWFFWGWFIGFAPMMAIFIAKISEGRSVRMLILAISVCAPIATNFWFSALGGTGIFFEMTNPGSISGPLSDAGLPAVLIAMLQQLPLQAILVPAFLLLTTTFVATTGDSMAYSIAVVTSENTTPSKYHRLFWAIMLGVVAAVLLAAGEGGLSALQSFIVITAVPVSILIATTLISAPVTIFWMIKQSKQEKRWKLVTTS